MLAEEPARSLRDYPGSSRLVVGNWVARKFFSKPCEIFSLMKSLFVLLPVFAGAVLSGCVTPQQLELIEREQRRLRSENVNVLSEVTSSRQEMDGIRASLADTRANIQQMQRDLSALKERMDETRYQVGRQIGQSSREGDQRIKDLEARMARLDEELKVQGSLLKAREEELNQVRTALKSGSTSEAATPSAGEPTADRGGEGVGGESELIKRDYDVAWRLLENKDYRAAIARFKEFLRKHPKSNLADNAQYWVAESHYALREFDQAILEFDTVQRKYPQGDKVPAALLKQGFAFAELGDKVDARLILQQLIDRYPQSPEAVKAKQKLKALES